MATIFLSHRSEDGGWARSLHEVLHEEFASFLSDDIPKGANWEATLESELSNCQIFVAVIGPQWVDKTNLKRLGTAPLSRWFPSFSKPAVDWVRRELLAANQRGPSCLFLPVLVGGAQMPPAEALPPDLGWVAKAQTDAVAIGNWKPSTEALKKRLRSYLEGRGTASAGRPIPRVLPYLCDRSDQEASLTRSLTGPEPTTAAAWVVHGDRLEGHEGFLSRLIHTGALERALRAQGAGVVDHVLDWSEDLANQSAFDELLRSALRKGALNDVNASDEAIAAFLRESKSARVFVLQVGWNDHQKFGDPFLEGLSSAWLRLTSVGGSRPHVLWINLTHPAKDQDPPASERKLVLPRLLPVGERHIRNWLELAEVQEHLGDRGSAILDLVDDKRWSNPDGTLAMRKFAEAIETIANS